MKMKKVHKMCIKIEISNITKQRKSFKEKLSNWNLS